MKFIEFICSFVSIDKNDVIINNDEKNAKIVFNIELIDFAGLPETKLYGFILLETVVFDEITESNSIGFDYYPFIYGILNCYNDAKSNLYVFYEFLIFHMY